jgi:hypothetical protein
MIDFFGEKLMATKERRSSHQTQWAAQFAVASELIKRGYEVAMTLGNHPLKDLMVVSPGGEHFGVDVKGLYQKNPWSIRKRKSTEIFYVLAYVPTDASNQFFILTGDEAMQGIRIDENRWKSNAAAKGKVVNESRYMHGVQWKYASQFEDKWEKLPH